MKRNEILGERHREDDEGWGSDYDRRQQAQMDRGKRDFKRSELQHELGHERNNIQVVINGRPWKVFPGKGYADSPEEFRNLQNMRSWAERKSAATGKKWTVQLTGAEPTVSEATPPGTLIGKISKVDPATKKVTVTNPKDNTTQEVDPKSLKPTANGKLAMDTPDIGTVRTGTEIVSAGESINSLKKLAGL